MANDEKITQQITQVEYKKGGDERVSQQLSQIEYTKVGRMRLSQQMVQVEYSILPPTMGTMSIIASNQGATYSQMGDKLLVSGL